MVGHGGVLRVDGGWPARRDRLCGHPLSGDHGDVFEQARYLFPLLALYALFMVLAARGLGRRWAPVLGGALVVLAMAHGLFAETLTISRYYG